MSHLHVNMICALVAIFVCFTLPLYWERAASVQHRLDADPISQLEDYLSYLVSSVSASTTVVSDEVVALDGEGGISGIYLPPPFSMSVILVVPRGTNTPATGSTPARAWRLHEERIQVLRDAEFLEAPHRLSLKAPRASRFSILTLLHAVSLVALQHGHSEVVLVGSDSHSNVAASLSHLFVSNSC